MNSSGPASKKAKIATEIDSTNQKSLMDMPEEVIEVIFSFTELADQKSLSEACKSLNTIFGRRKNLNKVWLVAEDEIGNDNRALSNSTRSYTNLHWNAPMPIAVWKHLSSSLTQLRIKFIYKFGKDLFRSVISALPFLTELTYLDFSSANDWILRNDSQTLSKQPKTIKPVVLKKLNHLKISCVFMLYFYNRFMKIESENLQTIIFGGFETRSCSKKSLNECSDGVRELIARQKNLKVLHLGVMSCFFDQPFIIDGKLHELRLTEIWTDKTREQEAIMCNFLLSQNELEIIDVDYEMDNLNVKIQNNLSQWKQNLKLKCLSLTVNENESKSRFFSLYDVASDQMQHHLQMSSVEELSVQCRGRSFSAIEIQKVFSEIEMKFPKATKITIPYHHPPSMDLSLVNSLSNINELTYTGRQKQLTLLKSITIPKLKSFTIKITSKSDSTLNCEKATLIDFFTRHKTLKKLDLSWDSPVCGTLEKALEIEFNEGIIDILRAALLHLRDLKSLSINLEMFRARVYGFKLFCHGDVFALISEYATPGFVYLYEDDQGSESHQILKRDDGNLVRKKNGRWTDM